jgi:hypothetical protein
VLLLVVQHSINVLVVLVLGELVVQVWVAIVELLLLRIRLQVVVAIQVQTLVVAAQVLSMLDIEQHK